MNADLLRAFLDDIKADPFDDVPRLILGDWLQEEGRSEAVHDRGVLLHCQCEAARLSGYDPEAIALRSQATELIARHETAWLGDLAGLDFLDAQFVRGMIHLTIAREPESRTTWANGISSATWQWVEGVRSLFGFGPLWDRALLPQLTRLELLERAQSGWVEFIGAPELTRLVDVSIDHAVCDDQTLWWLSETTKEARWRRFTLRAGGVNPPGWAHLGRCAFATTLEALDLGHCGLTGFGLRALLGASEWPRLDSLHLGHNRIPGAGLSSLVESPCLANLRRLVLAGNPLADAGSALLSAAPCPALRSLDLSDCDLGPTSLATLVQAPWLSQIETLELGRNRFTDGAKVLLEGQLDRVQILNLRGCGLTPEDLASLSGSSCAPVVRELHLRDNRLGDAGLVQLLRGHYPALRVLTLDRAHLTNDSLLRLAEWPHLGELWHLSLTGNEFSSAGLQALEESPFRSPRTWIEVDS